MALDQTMPVLVTGRPKGERLSLHITITTVVEETASREVVDLTEYTWEVQLRNGLGGPLVSTGTVEPVTDYSDGEMYVYINGQDTLNADHMSVLGIKGTLPDSTARTFVEGQVWLTEPTVR